MDAALIVGFVFLSIGVIFILSGLFVYQFYGKRRKMATAVTTATVTDLSGHISSLNHTRTWSYFYEYYAEGSMHKVSSSLSSSRKLFNVGDTVELYYVPGEPEKIYLERESGIERFLTAIFCGLGGLMAVIGLAVLLAF